MSPIISASFVAGSILLDLPSLFLIYAIVMKSPQKMKFIRPFLLKMVISEMAFMYSVILAYLPDIYVSHFPFPFLKVSSFYEHFGQAGSQLSVMVVIVTGGLSIFGIIEGAVMRLAITYNIQWLLKFSRIIPFLLFQITDIIFAVAVATAVVCLAVKGMPELQQFAIRHNVGHLLEQLDVEHDFVTFFDVDSLEFWPFFFFVVAVINLFPLIMGSLTYWTHRKVMRESRLMSTENYSLQKRLTALLLSQTLLPIIMLYLPLLCFVLALAAVLSLNETDSIYRMVSDQSNLGFLIFGASIMLYPLFNTVATIMIIKPYRRTISEVISSVSRYLRRRARRPSPGIPPVTPESKNKPI